jgi:hypothetical protein
LLLRGHPIPGQKLVDLLRRTILQSCQDISKPCQRLDIVELGGLCRSPNYAERNRFPQYS